MSPLPPTAELVARAWLLRLPFMAGQDADSSLALAGAWSGEVFVQTTAVAGPIDAYTPLRYPVVQLDVWAKTVNSDRPAWNRANVYAEQIINATYGSLAYGVLDMPEAGYAQARLGGVEAQGDPRKALGDPAALGHYQLDLQFLWVQADLVIT